MADVNLSKAVRSNLLSLQNTATMMAKTQERLATGLKVNSAMDNPTNFFTASSLKSRAGDLGLLMDSVSNAVQTLSAADKGISAITKLVESAQATARQALQTAGRVDTTIPGDVTAEAVATGTRSLNDGTGTAHVGAVVQGDEALVVGDFVEGETLSFNIGGQTVTLEFYDNDDSGVQAGNVGVDINGAADAEAMATRIETALRDVAAFNDNSIGVSIDADDFLVIDFGDLEGDVTVAGTAAAGLGVDGTTNNYVEEVPAATNMADAIAAGGSLTVRLGAGDVTTIDVGDLADSTALLDALNDIEGVTAAIDGGTGILTITGSDGQSLTIGGDAAGDLGLAAGTSQPTREASTVENVINPKRAELVDQYNELLSQINDLAKDASFNGVNLLNGDELQVIFNEDGSSKLDITGVTFDAAGLGLTELATTAFDVNDGINGILTDLKGTIETLRTQASKFGSNLSVVETRQNFTKDMINVLETGSANLTLADTNEEAANLLALQTRQQLASTALSMASQADQAVLRLF